MLALDDIRHKPVFKAVDILTKLKYGQLMTTRELAEKVGVNYSHFRTVYASKPELANNRSTASVKGQTMTVWGNLRTIEKLKEWLENGMRLG